MRLRELATMALERVAENPRRCVLWVVFGEHGVPVWDLVEPGESPGSSALWTQVGPISKAQGVDDVEKLLTLLARRDS